MRRNTSPLTCTEGSKRSASFCAVVVFPAAEIPVMKKSSGTRLEELDPVPERIARVEAVVALERLVRPHLGPRFLEAGFQRGQLTHFERRMRLLRGVER